MRRKIRPARLDAIKIRRFSAVRGPQGAAAAAMTHRMEADTMNYHLTAERFREEIIDHLLHTFGVTPENAGDETY